MDSITSLTISTYGMGEASLYTYLKTRIDNGEDVFTESIKVHGSEKTVSTTIRTLLKNADYVKSCSAVEDEDGTYLLINGAPLGGNSAIILVEGGDSSATVQISSGPDLIEPLGNLVKTNIPIVGSKIHWVYNDSGSTTSIPVSVDNLPITEMYPNLPSSLTDYYNSYVASSSAILVLIGPPGTGKTSFLRGLLHHTSSSATVSYDPRILEHDGIFANFISGRSEFMILEDSDSFLASRSKGNTIMHKFLNIGDGLVSSRGKKIIFTTNLPSTKDIDPALIRPGRCFDVLHFGKLTPANCSGIINALGFDREVPEQDVTLAELLNPGPRSTPKPSSVGFIKP